MKQIITYLLLSLILLTSTSSAVSSITNFEEIVAPPNSVFAGEPFRVKYIFETSIATDILINYTIVYAENDSDLDKVNSDEWTIYYEVDDYIGFLDMNETKPGEFSDEVLISEGIHYLIIEVHSLPNIISGNYDFSISLSAFLLEDIPIKPTTSSGISGVGSSGEDNKNIECFNVDRKFIKSDTPISYDFSTKCNIIRTVNFNSLSNSGWITGKVETLKNTSTLVNVNPPNEVFKNVNVWIGKSEWANDKNIKDATITFIVNNSWIETNDINKELITLNMFKDGWIPLQTTQLSENADVTTYTAVIPSNGFGNFAITGIKNVVISTTDVIPTAIPTIEPTVTPPEPTSDDNWLFSMLILILKGIVAGIVFLILLVLSIRRINAWRYSKQQ